MCRSQTAIICQRLPDDGQAHPTRIGGLEPGVSCCFLDRNEKSKQQWRSHRRPGMVSRFARCRQRKAFATQVEHDLPGETDCRWVAFQSKWNSCQRWLRTRHERHEWMNGRDRNALLPERVEFGARQRSAGMKCKANTSMPLLGEILGRSADLAVGNAEPDKRGSDLTFRRSDDLCADSPRQLLRALA